MTYKWEKQKIWVCVCVLYLSLLLRGFEEQCINHCNGVSLNVLIRPVPREIKSKETDKAAIKRTVHPKIEMLSFLTKENTGKGCLTLKAHFHVY